MTTCAEWAEKLAAAEAAYETMVLAGTVVSVRDGENEVKFSPTRKGDLSDYIRYLKGKIDACNGVRRVVHFTPIDC